MLNQHENTPRRCGSKIPPLSHKHKNHSKAHQVAPFKQVIVLQTQPPGLSPLNSPCLDAYSSISSAPSFPAACTQTQASFFFPSTLSLSLVYFTHFLFFFFTSSPLPSLCLSLCSACMIQSESAAPCPCGPHWTGTGMSSFSSGVQINIHLFFSKPSHLRTHQANPDPGIIHVIT